MNLQNIIPVLPSQDILRDIEWYSKNTGFECFFNHENMYAGMRRENIMLHLQWHADTENDPLLGGSVIRIFVADIDSLFEEFLDRQSVSHEKLSKNTPWGTHEFGLYDLNKNAIFFVQDI